MAKLIRIDTSIASFSGMFFVAIAETIVATVISRASTKSDTLNHDMRYYHLRIEIIHRKNIEFIYTDLFSFFYIIIQVILEFLNTNHSLKKSNSQKHKKSLLW